MIEYIPNFAAPIFLRTFYLSSYTPLQPGDITEQAAQLCRHGNFRAGPTIATRLKDHPCCPCVYQPKPNILREKLLSTYFSTSGQSKYIGFCIPDSAACNFTGACEIQAYSVPVGCTAGLIPLQGQRHIRRNGRRPLPQSRHYPLAVLRTPLFDPTMQKDSPL